MTKFKSLLKKSTTLFHPNYDLQFVLYTDSSNFAMGAVLCQSAVGEDVKSKKLRTIGYFTKTFNKSQRTYAIPEKKVLVVIYALEHFRPLVYGYKVLVRCDQISVKWLLAQEHPSKFVRYRQRLFSYEYEIEHIAGTKKLVPDYMRRIEDAEEAEKLFIKEDPILTTEMPRINNYLSIIENKLEVQNKKKIREGELQLHLNKDELFIMLNEAILNKKKSIIKRLVLEQ